MSAARSRALAARSHTIAQPGEGLIAAMDVELLSRTEMQFYFPSSALRLERMMGAVKSMVAIKNS